MNPCNNTPVYGTYKLPRRGLEVEQLLEKIEELGLATSTEDGLMSAEDKRKLNSLSVSIKYNTTEYWNNLTGYIPPAGEIIIYSDYDTIIEGGSTKVLPALKVGSGNAYVQDLAFITGINIYEVIRHLENTTIHITGTERSAWNSKLNIDDNREVVNETLIFNRN